MSTYGRYITHCFSTHLQIYSVWLMSQFSCFSVNNLFYKIQHSVVLYHMYNILSFWTESVFDVFCTLWHATFIFIFFFNSWHFFRFFFSQVPGFSDWFNIIYDNDEAIYTYQIRLWFRICRHGNNCLTVWVLQYTLDLIWMLRFNPKKTMF